jgi:hypothetical protein
MKQGFNDLWPTTVLFDKMNNQQVMDDACQELFTKHDLAEPVSHINQDGIFVGCGDGLTQFKEQIVIPAFEKYLNQVFNTSLSAYNEYRLKGWITGGGDNYSMVYHNHSGAHLSAVFYLIAEEKNFGGDIVFSDPRHNANRGYDREIRQSFNNVSITPQSGDILVFPSYLYHFVNPYFSSLRVAVPVDLFLYYD